MRLRLFIQALSAAVVLLLTTCGAIAQEGGGVDLKVLQWGLGGLARPGSWIGVQVQVTDLGQSTREVLLELSMPDPDGDTTLYQTTLAVGGEKKSTWIYARLPFSAVTTQEFSMSAYAVTEPTRAQREAGVTKAGALLGRSKFRVPPAVSPQTELFGVVGRNLAGLKPYKTDAGYNSNFPPMAHERIDFAEGLSASSLPDRWMGLNAFDSLVWTGTGPDFEPTDLAEDRADAIREWVMRGGHLVIVLPVVGQAWTNPQQPLADIFPRVSVKRMENVDLNPYRPLLSDDTKLALPTSGVVHVLEPLPDAKPGEATRLLVGPDGKAVVARRTVGAGSVTVIGLDVASRTLEGLNAVRADVFWNRVLGRRGRLLTDAEVVKAREDRNYQGPKNFTNRQMRAMDQDIAGLINKTGQAFAGVMLAFVLFALYWVVAGPLGFWFIKRREQSRHAWVAFVVCGMVFTAMAWGGATVLKPGRLDAQHLTIIDHVYGQDQDRAKVWASVLLPRFGLMDVGIGTEEQKKNLKVHDTLAPWDPPPSELTSASPTSFADSQGYGVNSRSPCRVLTPARSTTKNYVGEWLGGPPWKMPTPQSEDGTSPAQLVLRPDNSQRGWVLDGMLKNELPHDLKDVTVVVIRSQRPIRSSESYIGQLQTEGACYSRENWKAGEVLDLDSEAQAWRPLSVNGPTSSLLRDLVGPVSDADVVAWNTVATMGGKAQQKPIAPGGVRERLLALSFFGVLDPPNARTDERQVLAQRSDTHRWDLSRWFAQPCVIVVGQMENATSPVPLTIDGDLMGTSGRTVVRWVYPLPDNPPRFSGN